MNKKKIIIIAVILIIIIVGCFSAWKIYQKEQSNSFLVGDYISQISYSLLIYDENIKYKIEEHDYKDEIVIVYVADDNTTLNKYGQAIIGVYIDKKTGEIKETYGNEYIQKHIRNELEISGRK